MKSDPAIQRTRDARRSISATVDGDPAKLVEYYIHMQARFGDRVRAVAAAGGDAEQTDTRGRDQRAS